MTSSQLVSVVIPTYNRSQAVVRAIQSVLAQTHGHLEVLVVDDASTDDTATCVAAIDDDRVQYFRHDTNLFAGAARNTGMRAAKGSFIAFLDSDDTWYSDKLERQLKLLDAHPSAGFCVGGCLMKKGRGYREKILLPKLGSEPDRDLAVRFMTGKVHFITSTFIFRTELREQVGLMDVNLRRNQDMDFFLRMIDATQAISIEEPLAEFFPNYNPPSLDIVEKSNHYLLEKHHQRFQKLGASQARRIAAHYKFAHGMRHIQRGDMGKGFQLLFSGIRLNPFISLRQYASAGYKTLRRLATGKPKSIKS